MRSQLLITGLAGLLVMACGQDNETPEQALAYEGDEAGECEDGADNDQDQAFDCDDPGCAGSPVCQEGAETTVGEPEGRLVDVEEGAPNDASESTLDDAAAPLEEVHDDTGPMDTDEPETSEPEPEPEPEPVDPKDPCPPLGEATGETISVSPEDMDDLRLQLVSAQEGTTFLFADGVYPLDGEALRVPIAKTVLRSASGDSEGVIFEGGEDTALGIVVAAKDVVIAELSLHNLSEAAIQVMPEPGQSTLSGVRIYGVDIQDATGRALSVKGYNQAYVDAGEVACSTISLSDEGREKVDEACDVGGIDLRQAAYWTIRDNHIEGLWCKGAIAMPAILAWRSSAHTIVERNRVEDCSRGIGLGEAQSPLAGERTHTDPGCELDAHVDHYRGVVRNNMLFVGGETFMTEGAAYESGIHLWSCCKGTVVHNTVVGLKAPYSSIEWRREGAQDIQLLNNLVSHNLRERTGASAFTLGNLEDAEDELFVAIEEGDLHLLPNVLGAIDSAEDIQVGLADTDFEGDPRLGVRDIGADELVED